MFLRVSKVNGFSQSPNQTHDTLIKCERYGTSTRFFQTTGRHQVIAAPIVVGQIHRTDLGLHRKTDVGDQNIQRLVQTRRAGHLLDYFSQAGEHDLRSLTSFTSPGRCALRLRRDLLKLHHHTCKLFHHPTVNIALK